MTQKREISKLTDLITLLDNSNKEEYKRIGKDLSIPLSEFSDYLHFHQDHYTRNCIKRTEDYELILLCWEEGHATSIHCHNEQECWVHVVEGSFKENRYVEENGKLCMDHEMDIDQDGVSYMNDDMGFHSLENSSEGMAVSLHLYMDPIDQCQVFDEEKGTFEWKDLEYHSYEGQLESVS